ncbi:unnamed protein product [Camellia sinensis]
MASMKILILFFESLLIVLLLLAFQVASREFVGISRPRETAADAPWGHNYKNSYYRAPQKP